MPQSNMTDDDDWKQTVNGLRAGDASAVGDFWRRYGSLMHAVADQNLSPGMRRRVEPDDVVQSVCRTFFRRAKAGEYQLPDSQALWRLLCAITVTKVREQSRFHGRAKRGLKREVSMDAAGGGPDADTPGADHFAPADDAPTPADAAAFADQFRLVIESLGEEERQLVCLKLDDCTNDEAAEKLGCSERTVRRLMKEIQARLSKVLDVEPG